MSIKHLFFYILLIISVGKVSIAEEKKPEFMPIKAGEVSAIDGYVFTPEAIVKIYTKTEEEVKLVKLEAETKLELAQIDLQKVIDLNVSEKRIQEQLLKDTILAKDEIIQQKLNIIAALEKSNKINNYKAIGGFIVGSLITFTIVYFTVDVLR